MDAAYMKSRFFALIVVYKANPAHTLSLRTLLANNFDKQRLRILVWDNSPQPIYDFEAIQCDSLLYRSTPENLGLSKIYNLVISDYLHFEEHLLLLDQDTMLPTSFLASADREITHHPDIDLFLPMIQANGNWVSPLDYFLGWGRYWIAPRKGRIKSRGICAINSGMIISGRYLQGDVVKPIYDEAIAFYGSDTQFMLDFSERRDELFVLDIKLGHDLSFFSGAVTERAKKFTAMRMAYRQIYARRPLAQRLGVEVIMAAVSVLYACRYRSIQFLRVQI